MKIIRLLGLATLGLWIVPTWAQPGSMNGSRPPMGGMRGGMRSEKMRLPRLIDGAAHLSGTSALSKKQAKQMLKLISPWRSRPTMSEAAGKTLFTSLSGTLTASQKTALQNDRPGGRGEGGRMGGPGGNGGRGMGGGRPQGGPGGRMGGGMGGPGGRMGGAPGGQRPTQAQMDKMRSMMASYNPLYTGTPTGFASLPDFMKKGMERRRDRLNSALSQLQQKAR